MAALGEPQAPLILRIFARVTAAIAVSEAADTLLHVTQTAKLGSNVYTHTALILEPLPKLLIMGSR